MTNLLQETIETLEDYDKTVNDVIFVGDWGNGTRMSWEDFSKIADKEYDSGYGNEEVSLDLVVVGENFWMERCVYDGSEWWEYKELFRIEDFKPGKVRIFY